MRSVSLLPATALLGGIYAGLQSAAPVPGAAAGLIALCAVTALAFWRRASRATTALALCGFTVAGAALGADAARRAMAPSLRSVLDATYGGFALDQLGPPGVHPPTRARVRLQDDAAVREFGVQARGVVEAIEVGGVWRPVRGGARLTISGTAAGGRVASWVRGRTIEAPVTFRRPARFLNHGVADFDRDLALSGVALAGSVKSGLLVGVVAHGTAFEEAAARLRAHVRAAVGRHVSARDAVAGAIVTAILIGDRTALPEEIRERLQAAGTYHVIAISGGNIAILAAIVSAALVLVGAGPRLSALAVMLGLGAYALVVSAGPSVWRATLTALVYLSARLLDQRSPPWNAMAASAGLLACVAPLDVRDIGFVLTFGATAALLEAAHRPRRGSSLAGWIVATAVVSLAVEVVLLPVSAVAFSRATAAGLVLNLAAVPLMTLTQVAGLLLVLADWIGFEPRLLAAAAALAAAALVESARLVELVPWLAVRVPPPSPALVIAYYAALAAALWLRRGRTIAAGLLVALLLAVVTGVSTRRAPAPSPGVLRLTMFDVGQGDALLLQAPDGQALLVDAGGAGNDGTAFDIGGRVLAPALWAHGVRRLDALAITHGDPDHAGGAAALIRDFVPREVWQGVLVAGHPSAASIAGATARFGASLRERRAGWRTEWGGATIRVLHPPAPDWERLRVRNDDSLTLEVRYGEVAILLTGDIGADVERSLLPRLAPSRLRILKVAHHGSRTSTSQALLDAWRADIALISCGRGNRFGHPAPEVLRRLEAAGTRIYRTDRQGQITIDTDGRSVSVGTFVGHEATNGTKERLRTPP